MLRFRSAGRTHVGLVRAHNEDSALAGPYLQLVADGVGGQAAGEVASATAAYVTAALAALSAGRPDVDLVALFEDAVRRTHEQLREGTAAAPDRTGMGTTLTAFLTDGERVVLGHVGDSRAYLLRDGELRQLSHDHTFVQSLVDAGTLTREEARRHPRKNVVLQALDADALPRADVDVVDVHLGDRLLVCSDGLSDLVEDDRIRACLLIEDAEESAEALVEAALVAGGRDNVTCLVSDVVDGPRIEPGGSRLGAFADPYLVVDAAAVRA